MVANLLVGEFSAAPRAGGKPAPSPSALTRQTSARPVGTCPNSKNGDVTRPIARAGRSDFATVFAMGTAPGIFLARRLAAPAADAVSPTMLALGLILNVAGIGLFCWLIFVLAVYALPFFVALGAGLAAFHGGAGVLGALVVALAAAAMTLAFAQFAFAISTSPILRAVLGASFVVPAGIAGYFVVLGMSQFGVPSLLWREIFACLGATFVAITTWRRISAFTEPRPIEPGRAVRNRPGWKMADSQCIFAGWKNSSP
jgi:hypothetical protein